MTWQEYALIAAGVIGVLVAVVHGTLTQRLMVRPMADMLEQDGSLRLPLRRLIPALLQFSTFNWLIGGFALIGAVLWLGQEARLVTGLLVGSSYLFGSVGNCWGTRGRHPGWVLLAMACVLIAFGITDLG